MNHATRFTKLALLLIVAGALALAGCGGDDGVSQSMHDQVTAERDAAQAEADAAADAAAAAAEEAAAAAAAAAAAEEEAAAAAAAEAEAAAAAAAEAEAAAAAAAEAEAAAAAQAEAEAAAEAAAAEAAAAAAAAAAELEGVQMAAEAAAMAAKTASDAAAADAMAAMTATANIATLQTGEMSMMMAMAAQDAADGAMKAYMAAKMASETAAAAETVEAATTAKDMAEAEQAKAEKYAMTADEKSMGAVKYAKTELMIDGMVKSVGDSMVNAGSGMLTTPIDDDEQIITGLLDDMTPMYMAGEQDAKGGKQADPNPPATAAKAAVTPLAEVAARSVEIGKLLDTSDDKARLLLITHYADINNRARVFTESAGGTAYVPAVPNPTGANEFASTAAGNTILLSGTVAGGDAVHATLRSLGKFYPVTGNTTAGTFADSDTADTTTFTPDGSVAATAKPETVYTFELQDDDDPATDETRYVVLHSSTTTTGGDTINTYRLVDTMVTLPGITNAAGITLAAKEAQAMAKVVVKKAYEHLHFGVWADLGNADKKGAQDVESLGIGFVQSIGDGMTTTMPNKGTATYNGAWAAAVESAAGDINLVNGTATLTANLDKATLKATLMDLATLEGTLDDNMFSGTKATVTAANVHGLNAGAFTGEFSGGFYGDKAVEAGGIFDFESTSNGAFRGSFGGRYVAPEN